MAYEQSALVYATLCEDIEGLMMDVPGHHSAMCTTDRPVLDIVEDIDWGDLARVLRAKPAVSTPVEERAVTVAKQMLQKSAEDPHPGDWRDGWDQALEALLLNSHGIVAKFVPARYEFTTLEEDEQQEGKG